MIQGPRNETWVKENDGRGGEMFWDSLKKETNKQSGVILESSYFGISLCENGQT